MIGTVGQLTKQASGAARLAKSAWKLGTGVVTSRFAEVRVRDAYRPRESGSYIAAVYFQSGMDSVYQLEQWLWPMEQLSRHLGENALEIFVRDPQVAEHISRLTSLPVRFSRLTKGLDEFMSAPSLRLVFYVNQATGNFQGLRFPSPAHVHLSHGESEKISMVSNQLKAYDGVFTAGEAARVRIRRRLIGMSDDRMFDVGRPSLDRPRVVPDEWRRFLTSADATATTQEGPVVFYAPTWEGDSDAMAYGSLAMNGEAIVCGLLGAGYRVLFRPHPRTGVLQPAFRAAVEHVKTILDEHPAGFVDTTSEVGWQFDAADIALVELSSVAYDWLSVQKPLVMVEPHNPGAELLPGGLLDRCPTLGRDDDVAVGVVELIRRELAAGDSTRIAQLSNWYLGPTGPGDQVKRFISASTSMIESRSAQLAARDRL